ncbi:MAG: flagellar export chaperone FliS [Candidatus Thiodiazotropha sp.]|jgi:flagellar protein FliS
MKSSAINSYRQAASSEAFCATPHRLVQMLMGGALNGIANAKGSMERKEHEARHNEITWTISVIEALRGALDMKQGGEIAVNLDNLYDYMVRRLYHADINKSAEALDEVADLLREIKVAWDAMPDTLKQAQNIQEAVKAL